MRILLTGANGYIGKRLLPALLNEGHEVFCLVRDPKRFAPHFHPEEFNGHFYVIKGDLLDKESLQDIPKDIDVAYYLVHSMSTSMTKFYEEEELCANNFVNYIDSSNVKQVIYLSGIANDENLSKHLSSRLNVGNILRSSKAAVTALRAAIIIGSGSASFEIIRDLVEKLPIMVAPKWLNTKCQPIAIGDVIRYLIGVALKESSYDKVFDIGGPDILTYKDMLSKYALIRGLRRKIITVPLLTPRLSSYWLIFITATTFQLAKTLVDSMKNEVVVENHGIREIVEGDCLSYEEAVKLAFAKIKQNDVVSSWKDSMVAGVFNHDYLDDIEVPTMGCLMDSREFEFHRDIDEVKENIWSIGGNRGWYAMDWAWGLRGLIDKFIGGVGLRRGRRDPRKLKQGDALDFWRVLLVDERHRRLILFAEMKIPGEAWLEFDLVEKDGKNMLRQTATFRPQGLHGRLYWYSLFIVHHFLFEWMGRGIISYKDHH